MSETRLRDCIDALAKQPGETVTDWHGLSVGRVTEPVARSPYMYMPSLCVVAQGGKFAYLGQTLIAYGRGKYLLCALPLPIEAEITKASADAPLLAAALKLDPAKIGTLLMEMEPHSFWPDADVGAQAIVNCDVTDRVLDALVRFLTAVADPLERRLLGPGLERALLFELLRGSHGDVLRNFVMRDNSAQRISQAVNFLEQNYCEPIDVPSLAKMIGMSNSALHAHFKRATSMSPLQFLKKIRLHVAQSHLIAGTSVSDAAMSVGYSNPSQFSREFRRMFGRAPRETCLGAVRTSKAQKNAPNDMRSERQIGHQKI